MKSLWLVGGYLVLSAKVYILISDVNSLHRTGRTHVPAPSAKTHQNHWTRLPSLVGKGDPEIRELEEDQFWAQD